jgi:hypothetical protein
MDLTINQNRDFTYANADILLNWLTEHKPAASSNRELQRQLPLSPMVYWDSLASEEDFY